MKRIARLAAGTTLFFLPFATPTLADYTLNILHINDWHSRIEPINGFDSTCSSQDDEAGKCFGGAARLVTAARQWRHAMQGQNALFLNAGDNFQGSLFYATYKGTAEAEFLNLMGTDAMVVGNHEFYDGEDGLLGFLEKVKFPVLGSNVKANQASGLGDRVKDYVIFELNGEKIGIVGAVANNTAELASPGDNIDFVEDVAGIAAAIEKLHAEGVNKIIALTHVGYWRDLEAIAKVPGVDIVVGGHSHTLLSNVIDGAAGPYPTLVDNPGFYQVPVVQAHHYSKYLGELTVVFDDNGTVKTATGDLKLIDGSIAKDEAVVKRIQELAGPIEALKHTVVTGIAAPLDGSRGSCRIRECEMGNLTTDAMLARTQSQGATIAMMNGGSIRSSLDAGPVTMGELLEVYPFQNTLATARYSGQDILATLENGVSQIEDGSGRFLQVAGLRFGFDRSEPPLQGRVKNVEVLEEGNWVPLELDRLYTVATTDFLRRGGDGFEALAQNAQDAYDFGPNLEIVVGDYLKQNTQYQPSTEKRIVELK